MKKAYSQIGGSDFAAAAASIEDPEDSFVQISGSAKKESKPRRLTSRFEPSPASDEFILMVNSDPQSSWKADECMLSKSHPKYNKFVCEKDHKSDKPADNKLLQFDDDEASPAQSAAQTDKNKSAPSGNSTDKEGGKDLKEFSSSDEGLVFKYAFDQL